MLDRIWSGWRSSYVSNPERRSALDSAAADAADAGGAGEQADDAAATASPFTQLFESGLPDEDTYIVHRSAHVFVIVNIYPYTPGHVLVVPNRQLADLTDLDGDETADLWATVTEAVETVRSTYQPDGVNVGLNIGRAAGGSVPNHLHVHVVPRWTGDSNFMASVASAQTLPEAIDVTAAKLRAAWTAVKDRQAPL